MNEVVLAVFAPLLVVVGVLGFVVPPSKAMTSGAPAYNVFHLCFGVLGIALAIESSNGYVRAFVIGFGLIDLYQAVASRCGWFPKSVFRWKPADDVLHVVIGAALVLVGAFGS